MKVVVTAFLAFLAFYVYFIGYAAWFFFLDEKSKWAEAAAFFALGVIMPVAPALIALGRKARTISVSGRFQRDDETETGNENTKADPERDAPAERKDDF